MKKIMCKKERMDNIFLIKIAVGVYSIAGDKAHLVSKELQDLKKLAEERDRIIMVGHVLRYTPFYLACTRFCRSCRLVGIA